MKYETPDTLITFGYSGTREIKSLAFPNQNEYIYFGSWLRDRFHAKIAYWEYEQI